MGTVTYVVDCPNCSNEIYASSETGMGGGGFVLCDHCRYDRHASVTEFLSLEDLNEYREHLRESGSDYAHLTPP